jgi:hypothetical protein
MMTPSHTVGRGWDDERDATRPVAIVGIHQTARYCQPTCSAPVASRLAGILHLLIVFDTYKEELVGVPTCPLGMVEDLPPHSRGWSAQTAAKWGAMLQRPSHWNQLHTPPELQPCATAATLKAQIGLDEPVWTPPYPGPSWA